MVVKEREDRFSIPAQKSWASPEIVKSRDFLPLDVAGRHLAQGLPRRLLWHLFILSSSRNTSSDVSPSCLEHTDTW
jgi:hypothetical protein